IKAEENQIDINVFKELGYHYNYIHSAQKKGYSGVAIFSKFEPKNIEIGAQIEYMDNEGRVIRIDFEDFSVISLYAPSASNIDRLDFKLTFYEDFLVYIKELKKIIPNLIICGDYNVCHEAIDIHDPIRNKNTSGFLPQEREWFSRFLTECELIDSFRFFNSEPHNYSWWSYRAGARKNNKGWRIDYSLDKRIATSYPTILTDFLTRNNITASIEEITGSVEIATGIGLADCIFDIVSSGSTLITNGLKEVEVVLKSQAVLISNPNLNETKQSIIDKLLFRINAVRNAKEFKYIVLNTPNSKIEEIKQILPGMKSPSIFPLANEGWSSLHSVIQEDKFWEIIDKLKEIGAEGI
ncbi:unnamed protein product, partial [Darwinula stevensoni]